MTVHKVQVKVFLKLFKTFVLSSLTIHVIQNFRLFRSILLFLRSVQIYILKFSGILKSLKDILKTLKENLKQEIIVVTHNIIQVGERIYWFFHYLPIMFCLNINVEELFGICSNIDSALLFWEMRLNSMFPIPTACQNWVGW